VRICYRICLVLPIHNLFKTSIHSIDPVVQSHLDQLHSYLGPVLAISVPGNSTRSPLSYDDDPSGRGLEHIDYGIWSTPLRVGVYEWFMQDD
jgi:hypothetical protein